MLKHFLIIFCSKQANKYSLLLEMYHKEADRLDYIYIIGLMVTKKEKWIDRAQRFNPKR